MLLLEYITRKRVEYQVFIQSSELGLPNPFSASECNSPQGADPLPVPLSVAKAGRNHLNEEITSPPPNWARDIAKPYKI